MDLALFTNLQVICYREASCLGISVVVLSRTGTDFTHLSHGSCDSGPQNSVF